MGNSNVIDNDREKEFLLYDKKSGKSITVTAHRIGKNWMAICPKHKDTNPSLAINETDGYYKCFGCGWKGQLFNPAYIGKDGKKEIVSYNYLDENRKLLFQCVRYEPKDFRFRRPDGKGFWIYDLKDVKKVPYKLPEIIASGIDVPIFITEGEKDTDYLDILGFISTTNPMGAGNWNDEYNKYFKDRTVILIPDNDKQGKEHCIDIGNNLTGIASEIRWLEIPGLDEKQDISDWICQGNGKKELEALVSNCLDFKDIELDKTIESMKKFVARPYSNKILCEHNIRFDEFKRLWIYDVDKGIWLLNAEEDINSILRNGILNDDHIKGHNVEEIIKDIKGLTFSREKTDEPDPSLIPFKDKIYNLDNDKLLDYSSEYFFMNKLPIKIDTDNSECPFIDKLFEDFVGDKKKTLYELCAYCLYRGYPFQKFFIFLGEGRNGKSTFCDILTIFLGEDNISSASLSELTNNKFGPSQLFGKLVNICGEIDNSVLKRTSVLKQLTGGDYLNCERKFKNPFPFKNRAKIIITPNKLPETLDKTKGFYRRVFKMDFPNEFIEDDTAKSEILSRVTDDELEGLAKKCIPILNGLKANSFIFSDNKSLEEVSSTYEDLSSYLVDFLEECTKPDGSEGIQVSEFKEMFDAYLENLRVETWTYGKIKMNMAKQGHFQKTIGATNEVSGINTTVKQWPGLDWKF